jgi:hypothetical protein
MKQWNAEVKRPNQHPTHSMMQDAIKSGSIDFSAHLEACESCRATFEILRELGPYGLSPEPEVSESALERFSAVGLGDFKAQSGRVLHGLVSFDSWADRPALELRNSGVGDIRRVCLKAGTLLLEMIAERRRSSWAFVARVYRRGNSDSEVAIRVGQQHLLPQSEGFFHWTSSKAPRSLVVLTPAGEVIFEGLSWD